MARRTIPALTMGQQMNLEFEPRRSEGLDASDRRQAILALASILMQAAGLMVEELSDDQC